MKWLYFDSVGGASGDMILAALCDLGINPAWLQSQLETLGVEEFQVVMQPVAEAGLRGQRITIHLHAHHHGQGHEHEHHHRHLEDITALINASALPQAVKEQAVRVFQNLARAEGAVHGIPPEQVHFHEVGAVDSIVDIVGACLGLHALGIEAVATAPLPLGHGTIACEHGLLPSPAPAPMELLQGFTTVRVDEPFELVTPTGAALLTTWQAAAAPATGTLLKTGHGFGHRQLKGRPNLLRASLFESTPSTCNADACLLLECNLDDCTPEVVGHLAEKLREQGALDVFTAAIQMKKNRPGILLSVLCQDADRDVMLACLFTESTTFGVRLQPVQRAILAREFETVATPYGAIRVKIGKWQSQVVTRAPEWDDCAQAARAHHVPARQVYAAAQHAPPA